MAIYCSNLFYILLTQLTEPPQFQERAKTVCLIVANNESCLNYKLQVNMQVGYG